MIDRLVSVLGRVPGVPGVPGPSRPRRRLRRLRMGAGLPAACEGRGLRSRVK